MNIFRSIIVLLLFVSLCHAENNQSTQNEPIYIDKLHKSISQTIIEWSHIIDNAVSKWLEDNVTDSTDLETNKSDLDTNSSVDETNISNPEANRTIIQTNLTDSEANSTVLDENTTESETNSTISAKHTIAVKKKKSFVPRQSAQVKRDITTLPNHSDSNETDVADNGLQEKVRSVDQFFQNEKYLDETEKTYIRARVESYFESKGSNDFGLNLRAQMPFNKTKKRFKIFVDDLTLDNADNILKDTSETPDIGVHYYASREKILSRYSMGFSGIDPFVKARFNMPIEIDSWLIDPIQIFRYSTDKKFEEETNVYVDRKVDDSSLFRILLHRKTQDEMDGMEYALSLQYFRNGKKDKGFGLAQSFYGNTKYTYRNANGLLKEYGGIHDYVSAFSWRESIWRKWFYYEVRPSVSFHKQYEYQPNYAIRLFFDFYFGRHH